jgi:proteasome lid subunit RPN8/RPN11
MDENLKLRFSPTAWAKIRFLLGQAKTEIGGMGISLEDDLTYVDDIFIPKQKCTSVTVEFDDDSIADFTDDMIDLGYKPNQFLRIWIHTHPGMKTSPSAMDEDTFKRAFGNCDWAAMVIVSDVDEPYCRFQVNDGPLEGTFVVPVEVDFDSYDFEASNSEDWLKDLSKVTEVPLSKKLSSYNSEDADIEEYIKMLDRQYSTNDEDDNTEYVPEFEIEGDLLDKMTSNELTLFEQAPEDDKQYILADLRDKYNIGD